MQFSGLSPDMATMQNARADIGTQPPRYQPPLPIINQPINPPPLPWFAYAGGQALPPNDRIPAPPQRPGMAPETSVTAPGGLPQGNFNPQPSPAQVEVDERMGSDSRYGIQPRTDQGFGSYQPSAADFGEKQTKQQSPFSSDAGMWGILAAGLGILANNYGNYGQAGPAIGKGGMMGLQTFLGERQVQERQRLAQQELDQRNAQFNQTSDYQNRHLGETIRHNKVVEGAKENKRYITGPGQVMVDDDGKPLYTNPNQRPGGDGTQYERALGKLRELQGIVDKGGTLSQEQYYEAQSARAMLSQERVWVDPVTQQVMIHKPFPIPEGMSVGSERRKSGGAPAAPQGYGGSGRLSPAGVPSAVPNTGGRKALDAGSEKELSGLGDANKQLQDLMTSFKPGYGGSTFKLGGQLRTEAGRRLPDSVLPEGEKERARWWMQYKQWSNDIRAAKFGLTLTGNELTAFEGATPKESDDDETIENALRDQMQIVKDKLDSRINSLRAGGYNVEQAEALAFPRGVDVKPPTSGKSKKDLKKKYGLE
jgi:hypothetical protein